MDTTETEMTHKLSYKEVFTSPLYSRATFVGCCLAVFQQLTGINIIMFYSSKIFEKANLALSAQSVTGLVGGVNFVTTLGGMALLTYAGRRTIMLWGNLLMASVLLGLGVCSLVDQKLLEIVLLLCFIALFEFSSGPITWLYMAEIMQDKAVSIATVLNWLISLIVSATIPSILKAIGDDNIGYIFIFVGGCTAAGTLFIFAFMKETRGKSPQEIEELFVIDKEYREANVARRITEDIVNGSEQHSLK